MKLSYPAKLLMFMLGVYVVFDILLTPAGQLETRPVAEVKVIGFATLGLLFIGLVLAVVSLVLLFRRSRRAPVVAIMAVVLYFPAALADQTRLFSSLAPPSAIARLELAQTVIAVIVIGLGAWMLQAARTKPAV